MVNSHNNDTDPNKQVCFQTPEEHENGSDVDNDNADYPELSKRQNARPHRVSIVPLDERDDEEDAAIPTLTYELFKTEYAKDSRALYRLVYEAVAQRDIYRTDRNQLMGINNNKKAQINKLSQEV